MQRADSLYVKSYEAASKSEDLVYNNISNEPVNFSLCINLRKHWTTNTQDSPTNTHITANYLLVIQNGTTKAPYTKRQE